MEAQNGGFFQQTMYQPAPSTSHTQPSPHASFGGDPQGRYDSPGHFSQYNGAPLQPAPYPASQHQQFPHLQGGTGGDLMRAPQSPYTSAPYSQGVAAPAVSAAQRYGQYNATVSPQQHISPYATPQLQQPPRSSPSQQQPMAAPTAPPASQVPTSQAPGSQTPIKSVPQSPATPSAPSDPTRERERVSLLLKINSELLQEILSLQGQGKHGALGNTSQVKDENGAVQNKPAAPEYIDCMRRLQANLSYLAAHAEKEKKPDQPVPPGPAIMTVPTSPAAVVDMYTKLQGLFPGWRGQQAKASPGPQKPTTS